MTIDIVFDGPPSNHTGRFVEVEDAATGHGVQVGEWIRRPDGYWVLRLELADSVTAQLEAMVQERNEVLEEVVDIIEFHEGSKTTHYTEDAGESQPFIEVDYKDAMQLLNSAREVLK